MAIFRGFKPQAMQKIAGRLGYTGAMANFDSYLEQNPDKKREMIVFQEAAKEMARGGVVRKFQQGGFNPFQVGTQAVVYGSDGQQYGNSMIAERAGVTDVSYTQPASRPFNVPVGGGLIGQIGTPERLAGMLGTQEGTLGRQPNRYYFADGSPGDYFPSGPAPGAYDPGMMARPAVMAYGYNPKTGMFTQAGSGAPDNPGDFEYFGNYGSIFEKYPEAQARYEQGVRQGFNTLTPIVDPRDPEPIAVTPPAQATSSDAGSIGEVSVERMFNPTLPTGGTVTPFGIPTEQGQMVSPTSGQVAGTVSVPTTMSQTTMSNQPAVQQANLMNAQDVATKVNSSLDTLQAAQTDPNDPRAQILAAQQTASSVSNLSSAQGNAILMNNPVQRQIQNGEIIDATANAEKAKLFTEQVEAATATASDQATVQGQLASLTTNFDATNPPAWAAGAIRGVQAVMQQRGLGASSIAGQALVQAAMESALPIAQADARTVATFEAQNLSNRQQRAMLAAQQRAAFIGQEFDQSFQARVQNSAKIADIANRNFTADQQINLENSRVANTVNLSNLSNSQALVMAQASALAQLDTSNLSARQQAAVQNAQNFLQTDMANLSNSQQTSLFKSQQRTQSLFTDQAAQNASNQFNASSQNQVDQFFANLGTQVSQFNATQANAQAQFNAGQANTVERFNAELNNQRDQFNAQNQLVISQNNAQWRRQIATADTAAVNRANELNANALLSMSKESYDNLWQYYADTMEWAWTSAEGELDRLNKLATSNITADAMTKASEMTADAKAASGLGSLIGSVLGAGVNTVAGRLFS